MTAPVRPLVGSGGGPMGPEDGGARAAAGLGLVGPRIVAPSGFREGEASRLCAPPTPGGAGSAVTIDPLALDALMPMHLVLDGAGRVLRHGPLVARLIAAHPRAVAADAPAPGPRLAGASLFDLVAFHRPRGLATMDALRRAQGATLRLALRSDERTVLAGVAVPLGEGGALLDLSFGLGVVEAVRRHRLNAVDFAPTDMAVEMLYLVEANAAVMAESHRLVGRLQGARMAAEAEAHSDALTGLRNRRAFDDTLVGFLQQERTFGMMAVDLDHFKQVNDTRGHAAGDAVLCEAARIMLSAVRSGDIVARTGGDEFVILFPDLVSDVRLGEIADRLIEGIERPIAVDGTFCSISASIGVTTAVARDRAEARQLMAEADAALYAAKKAGRGRAMRWTIAQELREMTAHRPPRAEDR